MPAKRTNKVWSIPLLEFKEVCSRSQTLTEIIRTFGLHFDAGWTYRNIKKRIKEEGIDISHIALGLAHNRGKTTSVVRKKQTLSSLLVEDSTCHNTHGLKKRLYRVGYLTEKCSLCELGPEWNGQKLSLQIDHINGVRSDNRIENLRILCPNCHSQTDTFSGKKHKKPKTSLLKPDRHKPRLSKRKVTRPSLAELLALVEEHGYCGTARIYGVSDNAIRKWIRFEKRSLNLEDPEKQKLA